MSRINWATKAGVASLLCATAAIARSAQTFTRLQIFTAGTQGANHYAPLMTPPIPTIQIGALHTAAKSGSRRRRAV
jgi:hypothetical protein